MLRDKLKRLRKAKRIRLQEIADRLNIPYKTYTKYESSDNWPPQQRLMDIADMLGVSIDTLLGRSDVWPYKRIETILCKEEESYILVDVGDGKKYHVKKDAFNDRLEQITKIGELNTTLRSQFTELLETSEKAYTENKAWLNLMKEIIATSEEKIYV